MVDLLHRVRVFVFRYEDGSPEYLLLRSTQGIESFWTPLHGPIGFGEQLESAVRREVESDVGLAVPKRLIDLEMPSRWTVGDEQVVEWTYGFHAPVVESSLDLDAARWAAFRWSAFGNAYPSLELDGDRAAIVRLHSLIHAA